MSKYDLDQFFDEGEIEKGDRQKLKDGEIEDPREGYHVKQCCANCQHFFTKRTNRSLRGWCKYPNPDMKIPHKKAGEKYDVDEIEKNWIRTHGTMKCDNWELRSTYFNIDLVADWIELPINEDGTLMEDY